MPEIQEHPTSIGNTDQNPHWRFLEPAVIITVLSAGFYLIGYQSVTSFFAKLGYDHLSLDLPPNYYLSLSIQPILIVFLLYAALYVLHDSIKQHPRLLRFAWQLPLLLVGGVLTYEAAKHFPSSESYSWFALAIFAFLLAVMFMSLSWNLRDIMLHADLHDRIIVLLIFFIFSYWFAATWGQLTATRLIEGDPAGYVNIDFEWKNLPPLNSKGRTWF